MADTFRALCAELAENVRYLLDCVADGDSDPVAIAECVQHLAATRTALAQPEPQGPTDEELLDLHDLHYAWNAQADAADRWFYELGTHEIIRFAQRQALARWGRPLPTDTTP